MRKPICETVIVIILYLSAIVILLCGFFRNLSEETARKLWVFIVGLFAVYVLVVGGVYWSDYVGFKG